MKLMQEALSGRSVTTEQVRDMLGWLSFESSRLDFAKWAYASVSDRSEYGRLEREFKFNTNREAFLEHIRSR
jgi:hypothetical protein